MKSFLKNKEIFECKDGLECEGIVEINLSKVTTFYKMRTCLSKGIFGYRGPLQKVLVQYLWNMKKHFIRSSLRRCVSRFRQITFTVSNV